MSIPCFCQINIPFCYLTTVIFPLVNKNTVQGTPILVDIIKMKQPQKDLCTLEYAPYLIRWRRITVLCHDTFIPLESVFSDSQGLIH